jgi:TRAP-type C4-dicarboxylate transport system permease small subunit
MRIPQVYLRFRKIHRDFQRFYEKVEIGLSVTIMVAITALNGAEILYRYVFGRSIYWAQEMTLFLAMWMVFFGAGVLFKKKHYIIINFFMDLFSKKVQYKMFLFVNLLMLVFLVFLITSSIQFEIHQSNFRSMGLHIPVNFFIMPISVGSISIFLTTVDALLDAIELQNGIQLGEKEMLKT